MASRFFYGSKPTKQKTKAESPMSERPSALPRKSSLPVAPTKSSKIPSQQTSSLPRSKTTTTTTSSKQIETSDTFKAPLVTKKTTVTSKSRIPPVSMKEQDKTTTAIPRGVEEGMGTHTMITSTSPAPQRRRLRRKASNVDQRSKYTQSETSESTHEPVSHHTASEGTSVGGYTDPFPGSILGIVMPEPNSTVMQAPQRQTTPTEYATSNSRMASYVSRQPHRISTTDLPPPTPNFAARSSGSSSRYSESPGPFSRTSTPTSASSQSPGMLQAPKFTQPRNRPSVSPTRSRPPVTRRKITGAHEEGTDSQGLPALRESQTSSSSSSTVKGTDIVELSDNRRIATRAHQNRTPPTPPLRLSSKRGREPHPLPSTTIVQNSSSSTEVRAVPKVVYTSRLARPSQIPSSLSSSTSMKANGTLPRPRLPPSRPSREDVPPLNNGSQAVIVKSNLDQINATGLDKSTLSSPLKDEDKQVTSNKLSRSSSVTSTHKNATRRASITSPHLYPAENKKDSGSVRPSLENKLHKSEMTPTSASPSKSSSRFGLFSRRIKSPSEVSIASPPEQHEKLVKKGPAAGTGHEGYSRYARRGRSGSTSTVASRGRSTSTDRHSQNIGRPSSSRKSSFGSTVEKPELDDFYKDRLEPVVIGGGGKIRENRNSQSSLYQTASGQSSLASIDTSSYITSRSRATQDTSAGPSSVASSQRVSRELLPAPILATASDRLPEQRTLAHRRSLHRSQLFGEAEAMRIPPPINTKVLAPSPLIETYDSTLSSAPRTDASEDVSEGHEGNWLKPRKRKASDKNKLTRKWNFWNPRSKSPEKQGLERWQSNDSVSYSEVDGNHHTDPRSVAHYEMLDDAEMDNEHEDLEERLRYIEDNLHLEESEALSKDRVQQDRKMSMLLPSPPKFQAGFEQSLRSASPKVALHQSPPKQETRSPPSATLSTQLPVRRPPRLQQVGRIPRVVSKRERTHNPAPHSFSRPFKRPSVDEGTIIKSATERPTLALQTDVSPETSWNPFAKPASAPVNSMLYNLGDEQEFLRFSQRKDSEVSGSSSSGILSLAPVTAVAPTSHAALGEDEVWNEFDELLDDVGNGLPSLDSPELESMLASFPSLSQIRSPPPAAKRESLLMSSDGSSDTARATSPKATESSVADVHSLPLPQPLSIDAQPSPVSLSEFYEQYGDRSSVAKSNNRHSVTSIESGSRYSSQTMVSRSGSLSSVESDQTKRVTQVMAEKTNSTQSHSLRFSALMTSRWLSFDRVLFSPAQEEVLAPKQKPTDPPHRILILDGLQNDDWSAYCALTYPNTTIYNLASFSKKRESVETTNSASWTPPDNLRRVSHASIAAPFPFPKGFFAAVVFRFPAASPSHAYRNAISECKRVLSPGGYLELTMLDMDMVNMGTLARRAVRGVKERIAHTSPEVSLNPVSDTVMKLLGRRGFENINRCVVGVPVAGIVTGNHQAGFGNANDQASSSASASERTEGSSSLQKLLAGKQSTGDSVYAGPKMVARVGRWWWSRCYEKGVLGEAADTIWADKQLVRECERKQTGLRLVVCYAQKPESPKRRTVSV